MDDQPAKPKRVRAQRVRKPAAAKVEATPALVIDDAVTAELLPEPAAPIAAGHSELVAIDEDDDRAEPGAPATSKARKSDLRALGEALAADPALRHAILGAEDPIEASDAWLRAARGVRLRKRQRAAMSKAWSRAGALVVAAANGELSHWLRHR